MQKRLIGYDLPLAEISEQSAHEKTRCVKVGLHTVGGGTPLGQQVEEGPPFRQVPAIVTQAVIDALQVRRIQDPVAHFQLS